MKSIVYTLGLSLALVSYGLAQTKPEIGTQPTAGGDKPAITGDSTLGTARYSEAMKNLPQDVQDKISAARGAAEQAKQELEQMRTQGKSKEEIEAMVADRKAAALTNLQKSLDALSNVPDEAKERVGKAKEVISKRLANRKADIPDAAGSNP